MAAAAISKTKKISDFRLREEESIIERLNRLSLKAKERYAFKGSNDNNVDLAESVESKFARSKAKSMQTFLLHAGTFHY
jgi:hypothetical protein